MREGACPDGAAAHTALLVPAVDVNRPFFFCSLNWQTVGLSTRSFISSFIAVQEYNSHQL